MNYTVTCKLNTPILADIGASKLVGEKMKEMGATKVLLICDKGVKGAGVADKVKGYIEAAGLECFMTDLVLPDAPTDTIDQIRDFGRDNKVDGIVACGGGSTMDTGKAVSVLLSNGKDTLDWYNDFKTPQKKLYPFITIPTTSGTGAEITGGVVVSSSVTGIKGFMRGTATMADIALVDPELVVGMPPYPTAACAFDVLGHAIDAVYSKKTDMAKQEIAVRAIQLFLGSLHQVYYNGSNLNARRDMALASNIAGIPLDGAGGSGSHCFSHGFAFHKHVPHGHAVAIFTPAFIEFFAKRQPKETMIVVDALGVKYDRDESIEEIAKRAAIYVYALANSVNLPWLNDYYETPEDAYEIIERSLADISSYNIDPMLTVDEAKWIIDRTMSYPMKKK